jgi:hypothetical protein
MAVGDDDDNNHHYSNNNNNNNHGIKVLEKLVAVPMVKQFSASYRTAKLNTVLTTVCRSTPTPATLIQFTSSHSISSA